MKASLGFVRISGVSGINSIGRKKKPHRLRDNCQQSTHQSLRGNPVLQQQDEALHNIWQLQGTEAWADATALALLKRLRDVEHNPLLPETVTAMVPHLAAHLSKPCTTLARFEKRDSMAAAAEKLLQCLLDLGFTNHYIRKFVVAKGVRPFIDPAHAIALVDHLQRMNGGSNYKAVRALGNRPALFAYRLDTLSNKFEHVQRISGMSAEQTAAMVATNAAFLLWEKSSLDAVVEGLLSLSYTKSEACALLLRAPGTWCRKVETIASRHEQLRELLQATPSEVRSYVLQKPTILQLDPGSAAFTGRIQLWQEEVGRDLHSILTVPMLFQVSLKRSAARIAFMRKMGHIMTPSATELWCSHRKFCQRFAVSEESFQIWHREWLQTPMGLRFGS